MGLRVSLDGTILNDTPRGWDEAKIKSMRNLAIRGLFVNYTTDLEFWGDGFDYLDNILNQDYCQTIEVLIETDDCDAGTWTTEFNGIIQLTQITTYKVQQRIIKTKILDDSFDAKIDNNKSLKAYVDVGTSKNGENIQAVSAQSISVFDPTADFDGYELTPANMYRVYDCFRFIIDYMSDGQVGFRSDLFQNKWYNLMLCNGKEFRVRGGGGDQLEVSFKELFMELSKKFNLTFAIEPTPTGYANEFQVRIEETQYFEQENALLTLDDVRDIEMKFNANELYSNIEIGSKDFDDDVTLSYPPINLKSFKKEDYTILGQCNVDKTLNLVSSYIIDTNVLELLNGTGATDTKYDKKTIMVVTDGVKCTKYKEFDDPVTDGVDDGGVANRLTDTTTDFNAAGVVAGDMAVNMLTNEATQINSVDAGGTFCTLMDDIFNNGDAYQVRTQPYSYNHPLTNIEVVSRWLGGLPNSVIKYYSAGGTADFHAGVTADRTDTSFPFTITGVNYDDDSTAPFFDTGNNYSTVNFEYTVPASGLYGFEARAQFRLNGLVGAEKILNGDFSSGSTNWIVSGLPGTNFSSNRFRISSGLNTNQLYLRQSTPISVNSKYILTFDATITYGGIAVENGQSVTTSGTHTMVLDYTNAQSPPNHLQFNFFNSAGGLCEAIIDNVSMVATPRFDITQTIRRKSAAGVVLQTWSTTNIHSFDQNVFQLTREEIAQKTFSTFSGEKIDVELTVAGTDGQNLQSILLENWYDLLTETTKRTDFRTISVDDGGGDILPVNPDTFPIYVYEFDKAITFSQFKALKDAPEKAVLFSKNQANHLFGWRNSIVYDRKTSQCEFKLRSKTKINGDC